MSNWYELSGSPVEEENVNPITNYNQITTSTQEGDWWCSEHDARTNYNLLNDPDLVSGNWWDLGITPLDNTGPPPVTGFVSTWLTSNSGISANDQITLPLVSSGTYDFEVDWGDGSPPDTITSHLDPAITHTFLGGPGTYTVTITGTIDGWQFNNGGDRLKLTEISSWGTLQPGSATLGQFFGCANLDVTATDTLDTSNTSSMLNMFRGCTSLVTLSGFDTSNCSDMSSMFSGCSNLATVNTSGFDTSSVTSMISMFSGCSSLTTVDVSGFNTGLVTNMSNMFNGCGSLAALDVSGFNTANVGNFANMFVNCGLLTVLDVSGFNTATATDMNGMFRNTAVTTLALDQAGWIVTAVTNLTNFCGGVTLNTANYDSILAAWAAQSPLQSGVTCSFGGSQYTIATSQANRDVLTDPPNSWNLTDGGGT